MAEIDMMWSSSGYEWPLKMSLTQSKLESENDYNNIKVAAHY